MTIDSEQDLLKLAKIGRIVGLTLQVMKAAVEPGMTTAELDAIGAAELAKYDARSAPGITYDFPGATCISVNDEVAHGIPGERVIARGDLVKIDVSAELDGYFADAALTVGVPPLSAQYERLEACSRAAFEKGAAAARSGESMNAIGRAVEDEASRRGFSVVQELPGHGVGRGLHEDPSVPMVYVKKFRRRLYTGLVITIEPHISASRTRIYEDKANGWTLKTMNGSAAAAYEHTVIVMPDRPILVTAV